jgi:hypothetical protein
MKHEDEYEFCMIGLDTLEVLLLEWEWPNKVGYMGPIIRSGSPRWENYCLYADQVGRLIANFKAANAGKGVFIATSHDVFNGKYDAILGGEDWPCIGRGRSGAPPLFDPLVSKYLPELNDPAVTEKLFNDKTRIFLYQADLPVSKKS